MNRFVNAVLVLILLAFPLTNRLLPTFGPDALARFSDALLLPFLMIVLVALHWRGVVTTMRPGRVLYLIVIWACVGGFTAFVSDYAEIALYGQAYAFLGGFFVLALAQSFHRPDWSAEKAFNWLCLGGLVYLAVLWLYISLTPTSGGVVWIHNVPGFANVRFLGFFAVGFVVAAHVMALPEGVNLASKRGLLALGVIALAWSLLFWSGGRAPVAASFGALGVLWLYGHGALIKRLAPFTLIGAVLGAGLSLLYQVPSAGMGLFRFAERASSAQGFSSGRTNLWADTFESILKSPIIGHGADVLPFILSGWSSYFNHPHNFPLQFLHSWGLLGGGALILALGFIGHRLMSEGAKTDGVRFIALWGVLVFTLGGLVDGTFYHPLIFLYGAIFWGAALSIAPRADRTPNFWAKPIFTVAMVLVVGVFVRHGMSVMALGTEKTSPMTDQQWVTLMAFPSPMSKHGASYIVGLNLDQNIKDNHPDVASRLAWALRWSRSHGAGELMTIRRSFYDGDATEAANHLNAFYCHSDYYVRHMVHHMVKLMGLESPVCVGENK